ncbi:MAG: translation initiation factor eIF-1A [Thermoplasmata archaeon]
MSSKNDEEEVVRVPYPRRNEGQMFAIADKMLGGGRLRVVCEDGESRMGRIPGKLKKRMWIREGDLLIVNPWDFQDEKCDVEYRYTRTQIKYLKRRNQIPNEIDIF